jgi:hypothetical protein
VKAHSLVAAVLALPALSLAVGTASAQADPAVRWASPTGSGTDCTEAAPCSLDTAVEAGAVQPGDDVVVTPGDYAVVELDVLKAVTVHGQVGHPVPTVTTSSPIGVYVAAAATLSDLNLVASAQSSLLYVAAGPATIERVTASGPFGGTACAIASSTVLRDSVCRAVGANSKGVGVNISAGPGAVTITLRNVTALGGSAGLGFDVNGAGAAFAIDAKNVVARYGGGPSGADVVASANTGASVAVTLASSSYATELEVGGATVTDPGTGSNQTAAPLFVDAANGDLHQAPGSPTLDAGVLDASTGSADFEGDARAIRATAGCPARPDIGADEMTTTLECDPPDTTLSGPSGATEDSTPTYVVTSDEAGATFECRVGSAAFATCTSPYTTPVLAPGTHTVEARATDPSGNVDPSPATRTVTITIPAPPAQPLPPETTLTQAPKKKVTTHRRRAAVTFAFSSSAGATFECSLDGAGYRPCTSPTKAKVGKGRHTFAVRAVNSAGLVDPTPASVTFKVRLKPRR